MRPHQARFVTLCQQLLALGVVLAFLTPASGVLSLDVVGQVPGSAPGTRVGGAPAPARLMSATVPTRPVTPTVTEVPLTNATGNARPLAGRTVVGSSISSSRVVSRPQPVAGAGVVGVTWAPDASLSDDEMSLVVRTRTGDAWSGWQELEYHDEHAPDPGSPEAAGSRPGSEPMFVGEVDDVQVRVETSEGMLPDDLELAVVAPGSTGATETEAPEISTGQDGSRGGAGSYDEAFERETDGDAIELSAARAPAQPTVFSRAQWGADERIRDKSSLRYGSISAGFVHHTVNANGYSEAEVPAIIRSIYAYHVKSRGWSDIGYNFLVDRFGRIWEGRFGGIDKPVVGAHTLGYNDYAFAMSAIGNFETTQAPDVMLRSYGQLFAWKLSLHGVDPASMKQTVGRSTFPAINGHRDAGSTACPGKNLYAKLGTIRTYASQATPAGPAPVQVSPPQLETDLMGSPYPDIVVRRAADGRALVIPTGGLTAFTGKTVVGKRGWKAKRDVLVTPDVTGDGRVDLLSTNAKGVLRIRPGKANGKFSGVSRTITATAGHTLLAAVGDLNRDGRQDLVARSRGRVVTFLGAKRGGFKKVPLGKGFGGYVQLVGPGDVTGDGLADLVARTGKGTVMLYPGDGAGRFASRRAVPGSWGGVNRLAGGGDYTGDGRADLVARANGGKVYVLPGHGDGTFGAALGPAANLKSLRELSAAGSLVGDAAGDLVGVRGDTLVVVANRGTFELGAPVDTGVSFAGMNLILNVGDWNRDGAGDVITRDAAGALWLFAGNGAGQLGAGAQLATGFGAVADLRAVGDVTGDAVPDLVGTPAGGQLTVWAGTPTGINAGAPVASRLAAPAGLPVDLAPYDWVFPVQDVRLKGRDDYVARERATGLLYLFNGSTSGTSKPRVLGEGMGGYDLGG